MQAITVPYVIFELTDSVAWVGWAATAALVPTVVVTPIGGALADRYPRRRVLLVANTIEAALAALLAITWLAGMREALFILVVGAAIGLVASGVNAAWHALISDVVPTELVTSAVGLNSLQVSVGKAVGPALGGLVLTTLGPPWAFGLNAASFVVILGVLILTNPRAVPASWRGSVVAGIAQGARQVRADPAMRRALLLTVAITSLANPLLQLVAPFVRQELDGSAAMVGALIAAYGVGSVIAVGFVTRLVRDGRRGRTITLMTGVLGLVVVSTGMFAVPAVALLAFLVHGAVYIVAMSPIVSTFHLRAEPASRGRSVSVYLVCFTTCLGLGTLVWSVIAERVGLRIPIVLAGAILTVVAGLGWRTCDVLETTR